MNIKNLALVRAMKIEEFLQLVDKKGVLYPLNESVVIGPPKYLIGSKVADVLENLLSEIQIPYKEFYSFEEYKDKFGDEFEKTHDYPLGLIEYNYEKNMNRTIQKEQFLRMLLPLRLEYNSVILFSINGLIPDDIESGAFGNNTFSTDKFAVIIGLSDIIGKNEVASIVPTATALKGKVILPEGAYLLINEEEYQKLSYEQKEIIKKMREKGINCVTFKGALKEAVSSVLKNSGRYTNENLSLTRMDGGYKESATKSEVIATINNVASKYNIQKKYHFYYALEENPNYEYIYGYIQNQFFLYLQKNGKIPFNYNKLIKYNDQRYYEEFAQKVKEYGVDKFLLLIKEFNQSVLELKSKGKFPTPKQLIEANENGNPISIYEDIIALEQEIEEP